MLRILYCFLKRRDHPLENLMVPSGKPSCSKNILALTLTISPITALFLVSHWTTYVNKASSSFVFWATRGRLAERSLYVIYSRSVRFLSIRDMVDWVRWSPNLLEAQFTRKRWPVSESWPRSGRFRAFVHWWGVLRHISMWFTWGKPQV